MVKKISKLPQEFAKSLRGFEEIFEDFVETEEVKERKRLEKEQARNGETYELQNFLEEENARLSNVELFLTKKIPAKINFSQTERLIVEQLNRKNYLKEKIIPEYQKAESLVQKNLANLFNAHFS